MTMEIFVTRQNHEPSIDCKRSRISLHWQSRLFLVLANAESDLYLHKKLTLLHLGGWGNPEDLCICLVRIYVVGEKICNVLVVQQINCKK